jgi:fructokinase
MPGGVTRGDGLVKNSNTVCLNGRPFRQDLCRALGRDIAFDNDADCFALAETRLGAAAAFQDGVVFGMILGTGVGGGFVLRGQLWSGPQGIAGEWGHHAVWAGAADARPCYCGQRGCVEQYLSGPAVEADYLARSGKSLALPELAARRDADVHAAAAIETLLASFGRALANVIDVIDPSAVVLGGGVSNLDLFYDEGRERVARCVFNDELSTPILRHALGDSAGVFGAALLAAGR